MSEKYPVFITNSVVYLNPNAISNGDGSLTNPVKSMVRARALLGTHNILSPTIKLMNTIVINDNPPEWRFTQKTTIIRYGSGFTGNMIWVTEGGNLTLENVILDGNKTEVHAKAPLIRNYGTLTLRHAIEKWNIPVAGKVFLDAGCSTGGFTDYLLKQGATAVHAVDVGYNQLDYSLRKDSRVIVHERTNIMDVIPETFNPHPSVGCADLSFRSITRAASKILELVTEKVLIALVKPQFETERENLVKGVVADSAALREAVSIVIDKLFAERAFVKEIISSPIQGRKGNREFLFLITGERCVEPDALKASLKNLLS